MSIQLSQNKPKVASTKADEETSDVRSGSFRLAESECGAWQIIDQQQRIAFSGNLHECQMWLDRDENENRSPGFWTFLQSIFSDHS